MNFGSFETDLTILGNRKGISLPQFQLPSGEVGGAVGVAGGEGEERVSEF
jgi:hypothetical protein